MSPTPPNDPMMDSPLFKEAPRMPISPFDLIAQGKVVHVDAIGVGASETIDLLALINNYVHDCKTHPGQPIPLHIDMFDGSGQWGIGGDHVYDSTNVLFTLNQPAALMGLDYPNQFVDWLKAWHLNKDPVKVEKAKKKIAKYKTQGLSNERIAYLDSENYLMAKEFGPYDYVPRAIYGQFLKGMLHQRLKEAGLTVNSTYGLADGNDADEKHKIFSYKMNTIVVDDIARTKDGKLKVKGAEHAADVLIDATGHLNGTLLGKFNGIPGYASTPFTIETIAEAVKAHPEGPVIIPGTGQASLDVVAGLAGVGYTGKIIAISGDLIEPWPRDVLKFKEGENPYELHIFTPQNVASIVKKFAGDFQNPELIDSLSKLIQEEMHCSNAIEKSPVYVIKKFFEMHDEFLAVMNECPHVCGACKEIFEKHAGNPTSPERFALYQSMRQSGQLELVRGRVQDSQSRLTETGFEISVEHRGQTVALAAGVVLNSANMVRTPWDRSGQIINPALRRLEEIGAIRRNDQGGLEPVVDDGSVTLIGPAKGNTPWGIPYTREAIQEEGDREFSVVRRKGRNFYRSPPAKRARTKPTADTGAGQFRP